MESLAQRLRRRRLPAGEESPGPPSYPGIPSLAAWTASFLRASKPHLSASGRYAVVMGESDVLLTDVATGAVFPVSREGGYVRGLSTGHFFGNYREYIVIVSYMTSPPFTKVVFTTCIPPRVVTVPARLMHIYPYGTGNMIAAKFAQGNFGGVFHRIYSDGKVLITQDSFSEIEFNGHRDVNMDYKFCRKNGEMCLVGARETSQGDYFGPIYLSRSEVPDMSRTIIVSIDFEFLRRTGGAFALYDMFEVSDCEVVILVTTPLSETCQMGIVRLNLETGERSCAPVVFEGRLSPTPYELHYCGGLYAVVDRTTSGRPVRVWVAEGCRRFCLLMPEEHVERVAVGSDGARILLGEEEVFLAPSLPVRHLRLLGAARRLWALLLARGLGKTVFDGFMELA